MGLFDFIKKDKKDKEDKKNKKEKEDKSIDFSSIDKYYNIVTVSSPIFIVLGSTILFGVNLLKEILAIINSQRMNGFSS